jgi:hypothetical protein
MLWTHFCHQCRHRIRHDVFMQPVQEETFRGFRKNSGRRTTNYKWAHLGLNQGPIPYEGTALTTELWALVRRIVTYLSRLEKRVISEFLAITLFYYVGIKDLSEFPATQSGIARCLQTRSQWLPSRGSRLRALEPPSPPYVRRMRVCGDRGCRRRPCDLWA